jgi:hypothetical protein
MYLRVGQKGNINMTGAFEVLRAKFTNVNTRRRVMALIWIICVYCASYVSIFPYRNGRMWFSQTPYDVIPGFELFNFPYKELLLWYIMTQIE